jgi:hypothetical protein
MQVLKARSLTITTPMQFLNDFILETFGHVSSGNEIL